ncbi:MAG: hypothetical protein AAFN77_12600 [Planctomycetota bacterium]
MNLPQSNQRQRFWTVLFASLIGVVMISVASVSNAHAQYGSAHSLDPVLDITCELDEATDALRDELKTHLRRVRGYGALVGLNAQIHGKAAAIGRRFERNPNYRTLDRDVARIEELAISMGQRLQAIIDCPATLERSVGDISCIVARTNQILDLTESLRIATRPFCVEVVPAQTIQIESGYFGSTHDRYYQRDYTCPLRRRQAELNPYSQGIPTNQFDQRNPFDGRTVDPRLSDPGLNNPYSPYAIPSDTLPRTVPRMAPGIPRSSQPADQAPTLIPSTPRGQGRPLLESPRGIQIEPNAGFQFRSNIQPLELSGPRT